MRVAILARCKTGTCAQRTVELKELDGDEEVADLSASVGEKGANRSDDVRTIQRLLNGVEASEGGPVDALVVDGICGRLTKGAILRFQRQHRDLISDGLVERNRNTWKKLTALSGRSAITLAAKPAGAGAAAGPAAISEATQALFTTYLFLSRHRIFEAIKCLDKAQQELDLLHIRTFMTPPVSLMQAFIESFNSPAKFPQVAELATANRCFKLLDSKKDQVNMKATFSGVSGTLRKLRMVYVTMLDVIAANTVTTAADEVSGKRRFLRVVQQNLLFSAHPEFGPKGVLADAALGGWNHKDARLGRIRYGSAHIESTDAFTTLIHELAHFVSSNSTFWIGDHGYVHKAFTVLPHLAPQNAESYSWYALLASFKHLRPLADNSLPTNI